VVDQLLDLNHWLNFPLNHSVTKGLGRSWAQGDAS